MPLRTIKTEADRANLIRFLESRDLPFTVEFQNGVKRSTEQNALINAFYLDISRQTGEDFSDVRARCKLRYGVPIRRAHSDEFRGKYDKIIKPLSYEEKLAIMLPPIELPVTSHMSMAELTEYAETILREEARNGIVLRIRD